MEFIDIKRQYQQHKKEIDRAIQKVLKKGAFIMGDEVFELERQLSEFVFVRHCITCSSGTDALVMALMALGVGPGDEVITTPFTWISTAEAIALTGAKPVFIDIDPDTYNVDVTLLEAAITENTRALMPVNLFGQMPDYTIINAIAEKHGLPVIEDAAQSFGATQDGRLSCGVTTIGCTSFFPAKPLGCYGDGGAIFTDDDSVAERLRAIRTHGSEDRHCHSLLGINGRLDTIQAAIILAKLPYFIEEIEARHRLGMRYTQHLHNCCVTPVVEEGNTHVYAQYTIRVAERDALKAELAEDKIPSAVYYPRCLHEQPVFANLGYQYGDFPIAEKAAKEVLSLPMHPWITEEEQDQVINAVKQYALASV
ncbi:MAG: DegT/DnrJ/EryC1/StrS family aminotransferase [Chlamydiales bacterium]|nr:DegT/DnrJ/EryC1/StrS family aminotransferase [Chlamydiia bacterium]MCP5508047.1 DegT/DnrJ/EryC1/StrS family aminotransferase [Chlamydiales bacterium]